MKISLKVMNQLTEAVYAATSSQHLQVLVEVQKGQCETRHSNNSSLPENKSNMSENSSTMHYQI